MRVHELAKEMNKSNKEVLDLLKEKNIEVKSHMSSLSDEEIDVVKKSFADKNEEDTPKKNISCRYSAHRTVKMLGKWEEIVVEDKGETVMEKEIRVRILETNQPLIRINLHKMVIR